MKSTILAGISALFLFAFPCRESSLKDIAKPYLGVYQCTQATLGSADLLSRFKDLKIELKEDEYILLYQEKEGEMKKVGGKYRYDKEREVLVFEEGDKKREFALTAGKLTVTFPVGGKRCALRFERK